MNEHITQIENRPKPKGFYLCPPALAELIEMVNLLPDKETVKEIQTTLTYMRDFINTKKLNRIETLSLGVLEGNLPIDRIGDRFAQAMAEDVVEQVQFFAVFSEYVRDKLPMPLDIAEYILRHDDESFLGSLEDRAVERFNDIVTLRSVFYNFADSVYDIKVVDEVYPLREAQFDCYLVLHRKTGIAKPQVSSVIRVFDVENIHFNNIRECQICQKIFWAKREKSRTCSPVCSNILVNREYRKSNREKINQRRRTTHSNIKKREENRKKE